MRAKSAFPIKFSGHTIRRDEIPNGITGFAVLKLAEISGFKTEDKSVAILKLQEVAEDIINGIKSNLEYSKEGKR